MKSLSEYVLSHEIQKIKSHLKAYGFAVKNCKEKSQIQISSEQYKVNELIGYKTVCKRKADGVIKHYKARYIMGFDPN